MIRKLIFCAAGGLLIGWVLVWVIDWPRQIHVSTPAELIDAIGPNRTIYLEPGDYHLSSEVGHGSRFVSWHEVFDGHAAFIHNVKNLKLIGDGDSRGETRILMSPRYADVLFFSDSKQVHLENLTLGHFPEEGHCMGGVVRAQRVDGIYIQNCDLFGCGKEGLTFSEVVGASICSSVIRDCSYGIMTLTCTELVRFNDSQFLRNREYYGVELNHCNDVQFHNCLFQDNEVSEDYIVLLNENLSSNVILNGCEFTNNTSLLIAADDCIQIID